MKRPSAIQNFLGISFLARACHAENPFVMARLVEESNDLACNVLSSSLFMVHDTGTGRENNVAELTRGQQLDNPLLKILEGNVVARGNDTSLVETSIELNDNLAVAVVVDFLEFTNVT